MEGSFHWNHQLRDHFSSLEQSDVPTEGSLPVPTVPSPPGSQESDLIWHRLPTH